MVLYKQSPWPRYFPCEMEINSNLGFHGNHVYFVYLPHSFYVLVRWIPHYTSKQANFFNFKYVYWLFQRKGGWPKWNFQHFHFFAPEKNINLTIEMFCIIHQNKQIFFFSISRATIRLFDPYRELFLIAITRSISISCCLSVVNRLIWTLHKLFSVRQANVFYLLRCPHNWGYVIFAL